MASRVALHAGSRTCEQAGVKRAKVTGLKFRRHKHGHRQGTGTEVFLSLSLCIYLFIYLSIYAYLV